MALINRIKINCEGVIYSWEIELQDTDDVGINSILSTIPSQYGEYVYSHTIDVGTVSSMVVVTNQNECTFTLYKNSVAYTSSATSCLNLDPALLISSDANNFIQVGTDGKMYSASEVAITSSDAPFGFNAGTNTYNIPNVASIVAGKLNQGDGTTHEQLPDFWQQGVGATGALPDGTTDLTDTIGHKSDIYVGLNASFRVGNGAGDLIYNTAIGVAALQSNTSGVSNTASGNAALQSNTMGYHNTASGFEALRANTTGYYNTAIGAYSLNSNTTGFSNIASGGYALYENTTGSYNTASGYRALFSNTTGSNNLANGYRALQSNTTGYYNTASGRQALQSNTTGHNNTAIGNAALYSNTDGSYNAASGNEALSLNTTGYYNTASGGNALSSNTTGGGNTASGYAALYSNAEGNYNTASGREALYSNTTGHNNTASGYYALPSITVGSDNVGIGVYAGNGIDVGSGNTIVGSNISAVSGSLSDTLILGAGGRKDIYATAIGVGIGVVPPTEALDLLGNLKYSGTLKPSGTSPSTGQFLKASSPTANIWGGIVAADISDLSASLSPYQLISLKNQVNGYAGLDGSGKLNPSQLPALAIAETFVVATELAQLALTVQEGDIAVRTDENKTYISLNDTNGTISDWQELLTPTDSVQSVFGRSGVVTSQVGDYSTTQVTETASKVFVTPSEKSAITHSNRAVLDLLTNAGSGLIITGTERTNLNTAYSHTSLTNNPHSVTYTQTGAEQSFTKNSGFNKNFGLIAGTVAEGNHTHSFASLSAKPTTILGYGITDTRLGALSGYTSGAGLISSADTIISAIQKLNGNVEIAYNKSKPYLQLVDMVYDSTVIYPVSDHVAVSSGGYTATAGDLILFTGQVNAWANGVWEWDGTDYLRPTDADSDAEIRGYTYSIQSGVYKGQKWVNTNQSEITVATTPLTFAKYDEEIDPIFTAHVAYGITSGNITNWNTAYTGRNNWDGGTTGLVAATGRTSLGLVIGTHVQAYDSDLSSIASLIQSSGVLIKNGIGSWSLVNQNTGFNKDLGTSAGTVSEGNHNHTFASLTSKPTTLGGYGITDFDTEISNNTSVVANTAKISFDSTSSTRLLNTSGTNTGDQDLSGKQNVLVSGTSIKTINGTSLLGSGDIAISGGGGLAATDIDTLAELNAIITDATLISTTDSRLSNARTPLAHTLVSHSDVTITTNTSGEILKWNGAAWVNNTLAEAGIQPSGTYATGTGTATGTNTGDQTNISGNAATATLAANSTLAGGLAVGTGVNNGADQIVRTNTSGYIDTGFINTISGTAAGTLNRIYCSQDAYIRYLTPSAFLTSIGVAAGATANTGTVTSIATSGAVSGLTLTGGTITSSGTITLGGAITGFATTAHTHTFASLTSKPTTIAGYGITDFNSLFDSRLTSTTSISGNKTFTGNITVSGTFTENSSLRYKKDVSNLSSSLDNVLKLQGVNYIDKKTNLLNLGLIAEEVYKVYPEAVVLDNKERPDAVAYSRLVPVLIEAIKDLKKEIEELKASR